MSATPSSSRRRTLVLVVGVALAILATMGMGYAIVNQPPPVRSGEVISKDFRPAYTKTWQEAQYMYIPDAKGYPQPVFTGYKERHRDYPDRWSITLENGEGRTGTVVVTQGYYDSLKIGDMVWDDL